MLTIRLRLYYLLDACLLRTSCANGKRPLVIKVVVALTVDSVAGGFVLCVSPLITINELASAYGIYVNTKLLLTICVFSEIVKASNIIEGAVHV